MFSQDPGLLVFYQCGTIQSWRPTHGSLRTRNEGFPGDEIDDERYVKGEIEEEDFTKEQNVDDELLEDKAI